MQVAKQCSTGQSWLPDWTIETLAKVKPYQGGRLCLGERVNHSATGFWRFMNQTATKILGRDPQEPVSSLILSMARKASPELSYCLVCHTGHESLSLRGTIVPKQSRSGMRLPRPSGARNDGSVRGFAAEHQSGGDSGDEQDNYPCPWNTLHKESDGRSWAINNTSNLPGVE
jgi:hypothetical protein